MNWKYLGLLTIILAATSVVVAQGTFKPRDADEEHAWRLYNQYKASKKKEADLRIGIAKTQADIKTVNVGSVPGLGIDPADVAQLAKLRQQLVAEKERQTNLEAAWDKKFSGRYGELQESESTIYDPKTKQRMDKIRFRLIAFPFHYNPNSSTTASTTNKPPTPRPKPTPSPTQVRTPPVKPLTSKGTCDISGTWFATIDGRGTVLTVTIEQNGNKFSRTKGNPYRPQDDPDTVTGTIDGDYMRTDYGYPYGKKDLDYHMAGFIKCDASGRALRISFSDTNWLERKLR